MSHLDARLRWIAERVTRGPVADIGTDHGLLAADLALRGWRVVATDKSTAALASARATVAAMGPALPIELRQGDGFDVIDRGEVTTVVVAGMGGRRIAGILDRAHLDGVERLLLQPNRGVVDLRRWLVEGGWEIDDEAIQRAGGWHFMMSAVPSPRVRALQDEDLVLGPVLRQRRCASWLEWVASEHARYQVLVRQAPRDSRREELQRLLELMQRVLSEPLAAPSETGRSVNREQNSPRTNRKT